MSDKEHINLDFDFLEKEPSQKSNAGSSPTGGGNQPAPKPQPAKSSTPKAKYNFKSIAIVGGIILFFIIAIASGDSSSTTPSTTTSNSDNVDVGTYSCSSYNASRADALKPTDMGPSVDAESNLLDSRIAAIESEGRILNNMYVDEYDSYAVDSYNARLAQYRSDRAELDSDLDSWNSRYGSYDSQVDAYNNFLESNCSRRY